jgi:type 2A phosphatase activator TIP41
MYPLHREPYHITPRHATPRTHLSSPPIFRLTKRLGFPLPEMVFGEACLSLEHAPSGFAYSFSAIPALERVDRNPKEGAMKVAYAESWMKERAKCEEAQTVAKYYDWTFTTDYAGSPGQGGVSAEVSSE